MTSIPSDMTAVRIHEYGKSEKLIVERIELPKLSKTQVLVKNNYSGINYIDTYQRNGLYPMPTPFTLGREGAGVIASVGEDVTDRKVGDRVVYFSQASYAEFTAVESVLTQRVPDGVTLKQAASVFLQGLTAHFLTRSTFPINSNHTVLIQASAGGSGQLLTQMAKLSGARVIGTVGSNAKAEVARAAGVDHVINYNEQDFVAEVKKLTDGKGVDCVYDGVGAATYERSMKCCKRLGMLVLYGNASGAVPPISPLDLMKGGSLFLTRPSLADYLVGEGVLETRAKELFEMIDQARLKLNEPVVMPLSQAKEAHDLLESRAVAGKIVLEM